MIIVEHFRDNIFKVIPSDRLSASNFVDLNTKAEALIKHYGSIRLLVDASKMLGWDNFEALKQHFLLVKEHHYYIDKIAFVSGYTWQQILVNIAKIFVHPKIKIYRKIDERLAVYWIME